MTNSPDAARMREFAESPDEPFVMLNLLRFTPGGRETYRRYGAGAAPVMARYGATVLYAGDGRDPLVPNGEPWDAVLLVRYPSVTAFLEMIQDPEYLAVVPLREEALAATVLQPTHPWG